VIERLRFDEEDFTRTMLVTKTVSSADVKIERLLSEPSSQLTRDLVVCMNAGIAPARQTRSQHRHQLRTLTYACLEQANGGIVRDINHYGIGLQVVAAVRPQQQLRVRFELSRPRLRVETRGEVTWATRSGQCGIRFLDLPQKIARQIDEWILGNLLEGAALHSEGSMFAAASLAGSSSGDSEFARTSLARSSLARSSFARSSFARSSSALSSIAKSSVLLSSPAAFSSPVVEDVKEADDYDGLVVSSTPVRVIELPTRPDPLEPPGARNAGVSGERLALSARPLPDAVLPEAALSEPVLSGAAVSKPALSEPALPTFAGFEHASSTLDWLSQPLTGRSLIWTINTLVVVAALLLFVVVFLSITGEPPQWPLAMTGGGAIFVAGLYWGFFRVFGGASPGARLARMAGWEPDEKEGEEDTRFR
jgi:hypothetical protein